MGYVEELRALVGHRPLILVAGVALVFDEQERLLLIRRADTDEWAAPGGLMEIGETIEETARREVFEETGVHLPELRFLGMLSGPDIHVCYPNGDEVYGVIAVYTGRHDRQPLKADPAEATDIRFFDVDRLPRPLRPTTPMFLELYRQAQARGCG